jgi:bis(5'-nucleosyl)-tetraphosphatase (symmetrical)
MATYAIGDIQGCFDEFMGLLDRINFSPVDDRLVLVGDLVNRGPDSLRVLQWAVAHDDVVDCVLGNHDLHLLAVAHGAAKQKGKDTLEAILRSSDLPNLLAWLIKQPLVRRVGGFLVVHAGLFPAWTSAQALSLSAEVQAILSLSTDGQFFKSMYGNSPDSWDESLSGIERARFVVNVCTRMRMLNGQKLDFSFKGAPADAPVALSPWFAVGNLTDRAEKVICGHWSALGLFKTDRVIALDSGCVWGGALTAYRLEDGAVFQVPSLQAPGTTWE